MRTLRLSWSRTKGALPVLALAVVLPAGCGGTVETNGSSSGGGSTTTTTATMGTGGNGTSSGGAGGTGGFFPTGGGGTGGAPPVDYCPDFAETTITVELPDPGVPAEPGQICAEPPPQVTSNAAARVTLTKYSEALNVAMGFVSIAPDLESTVVGLPAIEVVMAQATELMGMVVTNVTQVAGGFTFHAEWPGLPPFPPESWVSMTVRTTFTSQCGPGPNDSRTVESLTVIHLCFEPAPSGGDQLVWVSSGDECKVCEIIAEMAPSPIVPDKRQDELPLARALRLRVRPIVKVGRKIILLAENDGGGDIAYAWRASGGEIQSLSPDVIVWAPPEQAGPHLVQAVLTGDHAAGVASYTLEAA